MIPLYFNKDCSKILYLYAMSPGRKFVRKELKDHLKMNNVNLDKTLMKLQNSGLVVREGRYYHLNFHDDITQGMIKIFVDFHKDMKELPLDVMLSIIDFSFAVSGLKVELWLFGSFAKLIFTDKSDIDMCVLDGDSKKLKKIASKIDKRIELHMFEKKKFYSSKKDPFVKDIIVNGVRLI